MSILLLSVYLVGGSFLSTRKSGKPVLFILNTLSTALVEVEVVMIAMMRKNHSNGYEKSIYGQTIVGNRFLVGEPLSENFFVSRLYWSYIECS